MEEKFVQMDWQLQELDRAVVGNRLQLVSTVITTDTTRIFQVLPKHIISRGQNTDKAMNGDEMRGL